jgi:exportin-2 (importin alpha re-exporter)
VPGSVRSLTQHAESEAKPGLLQQAQAQVCNVAAIFVEKYEEEFAPFLPLFLQESWQLLLRVDTAPRNDRLAVSALIFLQRVATSTSHELFQAEATLRSICEMVIVPNVTLTEIDCELFEDNPTEYISRDIEGSDSDTRRRAACELVKALRRHYERDVSPIFTSYIEPAAAALRHRGRLARQGRRDVPRHGARRHQLDAGARRLDDESVCERDRLLRPPRAGRAAERRRRRRREESEVGANIVRADALRFSSLFRQTLPVESYPTLLELFVQLLRSSDSVVQTYAAACVANFLTVKDRPPAVPKPVARVTPALLAPVLAGAVSHLCALLPSPTSGVRENAYVMRALLRVISSAKETILPHCAELSKALVVTLAHVAANPLNATFNHFPLRVARCADPRGRRRQSGDVGVVRGAALPGVPADSRQRRRRVRALRVPAARAAARGVAERRHGAVRVAAIAAAQRGALGARLATCRRWCACCRRTRAAARRSSRRTSSRRSACFSSCCRVATPTTRRSTCSSR